MLKPFQVVEEKVKSVGRFFLIEADLITSEGKNVTWDIFSWKDGVIVLAMDDDKNVYIKREWRLNRKDFTWEVVSGAIEVENPTEEQIVEAAQRELQEEIGMKAGKLEKLITIYPFNHMRNKFHIFLATELSESKLESDEHEHLEVKKLSFKDAYNLVVNQPAPTGQNVIAFQLAREKLSF